MERKPLLNQIDQFDARVTFRCNKQQKHGLIFNAQHQGVTLGAYLRRALFNAAVPKQSRRLPPASLKPELALLKREVSMNRSNMNQITHQLNTWNLRGYISDELVAPILPLLSDRLTVDGDLLEYLYQLLLRSDI